MTTLNLSPLANLHCVTLRYLVPLPCHGLKVRWKTDGDTPSTCYVKPYVLCPRDISKIVSCYQRVSLSCVCVCVCWGGGLFYYTTDAASLVKGVKSCWDIRGNYATKSTVAECVKRLCLDCVAELLAAFLESPGVDGEAG